MNLSRQLDATPQQYEERHRHFDPRPALDSRGQVPSMPYDAAPLACSAPSYPKGHIVLHPFSQPRPQHTWPPSIESVCPLLTEIGQRARAGGELEGWGGAFSDGDSKIIEQLQASESSSLQFPVWDPSTPKVSRPEPGDPSEEEEFLLHVYQGNGKMAVVGPFSLRTLPEQGALMPTIQRALDASPLPSARYPKGREEAHLYVCTHGSRDCRCGVAGTDLLDTLNAEVSKHESRQTQPAGAYSESGLHHGKKVKVFGVSHVGGHKWAANALLYPHGDWYGNLRDSDAPLLLRSALAPSTSRHDLSDRREKLVHWPRWRGRLGLTTDEMNKVWEEWGGGLVQTAVIQPVARRRGPANKEATPASKSESSPSTAPLEGAEATASQEPLTIPFRKHDGAVHRISASLGENLKDVAVRGGLSEIEATCGGKCECATCHAYLAAPAAGRIEEQSLPQSPVILKGEDDRVDAAVNQASAVVGQGRSAALVAPDLDKGRPPKEVLGDPTDEENGK